MSLTTTPPTSVEEPPSAAQTTARRLRSARGIALFLLAIAVIAVLLAAIKPRVEAQYADPTSAKRDGTRALAQILSHRGTTVQVARNATDASARMRTASGALLVVVRSDRLLLSDLGVLADTPGDRLLVEPTNDTLKSLAPSVQRAAGQSSALVKPGCTTWPEVAMAGSVDFGDGYTYETSATGADKCFLDDGQARLIRVRTATGATSVLSSGAPFTNQNLADDGNAALALNLLGAHQTVVWLIPDLPLKTASSGDGGGGRPTGGGDQHQNDNGGNQDNGNNSAADKTLYDLVPDGVWWAMLQLVVVTVLVGFWRGRRLGTVVAERLPVIVRSAETVEGRARLYRGRRARGRAAEALRAGTRERLVPRLGIARGAAQDPGMSREIVRAVAGRTEWDETTIGWALYGPEPADDAELIRLSDFLGDLESKVLGA